MIHSLFTCFIAFDLQGSQFYDYVKSVMDYFYYCNGKLYVSSAMIFAKKKKLPSNIVFFFLIKNYLKCLSKIFSSTVRHHLSIISITIMESDSAILSMWSG